MTKKQKQFNQLLLGFLTLILIGITFGSCEADKDFVISKKYDNEISFQQFKQETGLYDFKTKIHINPDNLNTGAARLADGTYELSDFDITTDIIKKLEANDIKSYCFRIIPKIKQDSPDSPSIFNLALIKKDTEWQASIIEFKPTLVNYENIKNGVTEKVEGKAKLWYQGDLANYASTPQDAMRCVTVEIVVNSFYCEGCDGEPCDYYSANGCGSTVLGHQCGPRVEISSTTICSFGPPGGVSPPGGVIPPSGGNPIGGSSNTGPPPVVGPFEPIVYPPINWFEIMGGDTQTPAEQISQHDSPFIANVKDINGDFEGQNNVPCDDLKAKDEDSIFSSKLVELKSKAATQTYESAYVIYQNPFAGTVLSQEFTGSNIKKEALISFQGAVNYSLTDVTAILHCHLDNGSTFKVFSFSDILALGDIATNSTRPQAEYAIYVTTDSGTFALKVSDKVTLKNRLNYLKLMYVPFEDIFKLKVKMKDSVEDQKINFLKFIKDLPGGGNPGIDLYEKNEANGKWDKLTLSSSGNSVEKTPCN